MALLVHHGTTGACWQSSCTEALVAYH